MPREIVLTSCNVFKAGNGQEYGLVSIDDSEEVIVFKKREDGSWIGHVQFDFFGSSGLAPGQARPEIAEAFDSLVTIVVGPETPA